MDVLDLRGDWAAPPTPAMRAAMADAAVGDDNSVEDPTVNRLERLAADIFGKEAALFVPSGTMGNLIAILTLAPWGSEVIAGAKSHIVNAEQGGAAVLGGRSVRVLPNDTAGRMDPVAISRAILPDDIHYPPTGLLCLENTQNQCGGVVLDLQTMAEQVAPAREAGIPVHLDGSRIWNAAAALGVSEAAIAASCDTVQACLSKGLAAPVGSVLAGTRQAMDTARRHRKLLGGGMRQAGVIAAAGIVALEQMRPRIGEDHARARRLAGALAERPELNVDLASVQTNLVYATTALGINAEALAAAMEREGIRISAFGASHLRYAIHYAIDDAGIERTIGATRAALSGARSVAA
ncbi:MAG TPA: GntG family PLP-dependent aldolase [Thermomicrobiales bacterium]|nr:GntG family PLP-dependent aldolase [Thermomicrobiales bacterium]